MIAYKNQMGLLLWICVTHRVDCLVGIECLTTNSLCPGLAGFLGPVLSWCEARRKREACLHAFQSPGSECFALPLVTLLELVAP